MAETVKKNANDAFKTAGMTANEYMETVTGFSASLIGSLNNDTAKAVSPEELLPLYLRLPQAERELKAKTEAKK